MRRVLYSAHALGNMNYASDGLAAPMMTRSFVAAIFLALFLTSFCVVGPAKAGTPPIGDFDSNLVPNASLQGTTGVIAATSSTINGDAPTLWRVFATNGSVVNLERLTLAADTLYPGSPPTQALKFSVATFGTDQGLDSIPGFFSIRTGISYGAQIYARSGNSDNSDQPFTLALLIYDSALTFTGHLGTLAENGGASWAPFTTTAVTGVAGDLYAKLTMRVVDNGGENSIIIALPTVEGPPAYNTAPNPGFAGNAGAIQGNVTGTIPDDWRAFAVGAGSINVTTVPVAAGELFPGSPPTDAVPLQVIGGGKWREGFDHEVGPAGLCSDQLYRGEMYMRSGNSDMSAQGVSFGMPIFDAAGNYTGLAPGSFNTTVGPAWSFMSGPQFRANTGETTNLGFRPAADGGEDILLIAAPRIVDPAGWMLFTDGFD